MIQEPDRKNEFALVSFIRDVIHGVGKAVTPVTAETYQTLFKRLIETDKLPENAKSRNTYYLWRAAYVYGLAAEARLALIARDKAVFGSMAWSASMAKLEKLKSELDKYPPDQQRVHQASGSSSFTWSDVKNRCAQDGERISAKSSKRVGLAALVKRTGWRDSLFAAISTNYSDAAAIVLVAGVRPKEIQNGIQVSVIDGNLCVTVKGAKVGKSRGQPERAILVAVDCAAAKHLAKLAAYGPITVTTKPKSLCEAFRRAGRRAFPRMRLSVSPYSARHALASDLKAAGVDPDGIAQVLGHCATRSQQAYGRASIRGRSGFSVLGVRASLPVRDTRRNPASSFLSTPGHANPRLG